MYMSLMEYWGEEFHPGVENMAWTASSLKSRMSALFVVRVRRMVIMSSMPALSNMEGDEEEEDDAPKNCCKNEEDWP